MALKDVSNRFKEKIAKDIERSPTLKIFKEVVEGNGGVKPIWKMISDKRAREMTKNWLEKVRASYPELHSLLNERLRDKNIWEMLTDGGKLNNEWMEAIRALSENQAAKKSYKLTEKLFECTIEAKMLGGGSLRSLKYIFSNGEMQLLKWAATRPSMAGGNGKIILSWRVGSAISQNSLYTSNKKDADSNIEKNLAGSIKTIINEAFQRGKSSEEEMGQYTEQSLNIICDNIRRAKDPFHYIRSISRSLTHCSAEGLGFKNYVLKELSLEKHDRKS